MKSQKVWADANQPQALRQEPVGASSRGVGTERSATHAEDRKVPKKALRRRRASADSSPASNRSVL